MREIIEKNTGCVLIGVLRSLVGELIIEKNTGCVLFLFLYAYNKLQHVYYKPICYSVLLAVLTVFLEF